MFGLLRRNRLARTSRKAPSFRTILRVDGLEYRDVPSDISTGSDGISMPTNQPPQIVGFTVTRVGTGLYLISGTVVDENPGGLTVTIGGSTSAAGSSTTTWSDRTFSMVVTLQTNGTDVGYITATTVDDHNQTSNEPSVFVTPS
jgi:hypothetical protein